MSQQVVSVSFTWYLQVLGLISLSLALLNLLPLLPLDGGHILFSIVEGIRGKAVGREVYERVSAIGIALFLVLMFIGLSNDINRLGGGYTTRRRVASKRHICVGGVTIGGGAPVVVQSMTLTKTHDVEATTAQIAALASAGCEIVRVAVPKTEDAEALGRIVRLLADPDDRRHPLQRQPGAEGDRPGRRGRSHQPGQHRRLGQGRPGRASRAGGRDPDADRRELRLAAEAS